MIKGVVFDLDGVLVDSPKIYFKIMKKFLQNQGLNVTDQEISNLIALSLREEFEHIKSKHGLKTTYQEFLSATLDESISVSKTELELNVGARELIFDLKKSGLKVGLASNNTLKTINFVLGKFGLHGVFSTVVSAENVKQGKPEPEIYLKAVQEMGLLPKECAAIEDTLIGVRSVKSAGLKCIVFQNKYANGYSFPEADLIINNFGELTPKKILGL